METDHTFQRALVIANPGSGRANREKLEAALDRHAGAIELRIRWLGEGEDAETVAREGLRSSADNRSGFDLVVAAGGDGTVSAVARAAVEVDIPIAIAPMGTANQLAVQLRIPGDLSGALRLLSEGGAIRRIDAMEIVGRLHLLNAGIGLSAQTVHDVPADDKRRFGLFAYLWTGVTRSFSFTPVLCTISVDDDVQQLRALDVSIINAGFREGKQVPGFPSVDPDDGRLNVLTVWAPSASEYLAHLWRAFTLWRRVNPNIKWSVAQREVRIECAEPTPIQADGDLIGETPVTVRIVRSAVGVLVPAG